MNVALLRESPRTSPRVVILGGGIAGMATAISLQRFRIESVIYERTQESGREGLGFLLQPNGLDVLDTLNLGEEARARGNFIRRFILQRPDRRIVLDTELPDELLAMRRLDIVELLREQLPAHTLRTGMKFVDFEQDEQGIARRARFENGHEVEGDLFIASDGVRSRARAGLFPEHCLSRVRVKELCSITYAPHIVRQLGSLMVKTQEEKGGLAAGVVPCGPDHVVWYIQFDAERWPLDGNDPQAKKEFARELVGRWPEPLPSIIELTDFSDSHVWFTTDLDPLPSFHRGNVVLVGDAAHPLLPFTSQGVGSALQDALSLATHIGGQFDCPQKLEQGLQVFSEERRTCVKRFLESGRELAERFLHPEKFAGQDLIPLSK